MFQTNLSFFIIECNDLFIYSWPTDYPTISPPFPRLYTGFCFGLNGIINNKRWFFFRYVCSSETPPFLIQSVNIGCWIQSNLLVSLSSEYNFKNFVKAAKNLIMFFSPRKCLKNIFLTQECLGECEGVWEWRRLVGRGETI